jgi:hypothetical protein
LPQPNLNDNAEVSLDAFNTIKGRLDYRRVFYFLLKHLPKPVEVGLVPFGCPSGASGQNL